MSKPVLSPQKPAENLVLIFLRSKKSTELDTFGSSKGRLNGSHSDLVLKGAPPASDMPKRSERLLLWLYTEPRHTSSCAFLKLFTQLSDVHSASETCSLERVKLCKRCFSWLGGLSKLYATLSTGVDTDPDGGYAFGLFKHQ